MSVLCLFATLTSCSSRRYLQEGEHLLQKNNIVITDKAVPSGEATRLKELLLPSVQPQPNSNYFFFFPKERAALKYRFEADTPRFTAWLMELDGESPALTDTMTIEASAERIERRLGAEGYYQAKAGYSIDYGRKRTHVTYDVTPGKRYLIGEHRIVCPDTAVARLIAADSAQQAMDSAVAITEGLHNTERKRITSLLRNNGYYDFSPSDISKFVSDTSSGSADTDLYIQYPTEDSTFTQYQIGSITVYPGYNPTAPATAYKDTLIQGVIFRILDNQLIVKPRMILEKLDFDVGDLYSYKSYRQTILQLNTLDIFKTPRIAVKKRIFNPGILDYEIFLVKDKKFNDEFGFENFVSSFGSGELLFGISMHGGRQIKNLLGGAETFSLDLDGSFESSFKDGDNGSITTLNIGTSLLSPRYDDLGSLWLLRKLPLAKRMLPDGYMHDLRTLGEQFIRVNLAFEDVQQFYQSTAFNASRGVQLTRGRHKTSWVFQGFDLLSPQEKSQFDTIVGNNEPFRQSFQQQLTTGLLFRSLNYAYQGPVKNNTALTISAGFEASGHEVALFNLITNDALTSINFLGDSFTFNQFIKFEVEPKLTWYLNRQSSFAFRFGTGIIYPFNRKDRLLPYNELFSLGGSYSLRGWRPRDVGPGGANFTGEVVPYSAGQFKLELSAEYRQKLGWIVEGALFADAGNIWDIWELSNGIDGSDPDLFRPSWDTYGLSGGTGLRFDLTFFLFRVDVAWALRNWYESSPGAGDYWRTTSLDKVFSDPQFNIGINYPF